MTQLFSSQQIFLAAAVGLIAVLFILRKWKMHKMKPKIRQMLAQGGKVIDVRTRSEFASGHFRGAVNIPLDELESKFASLGRKDTPILVYCASGIRSSSAKRILESAGFTHVENGINTGYMESVASAPR